VNRERTVGGAVLTGGAASRLGCDKARVALGGEPLLTRVLRSVLESVPQVSLVAPDPGRYADLCPPGVDLIADEPADSGPLGGLRAALAASAGERVFVCAGDMPNLTSSLIRRLIALAVSGGADVTVPCHAAGLEPLCAVYTVACLPHVEWALGRGRRRIISFYPRVDVCRIGPGQLADCGDPEVVFFNINTPADLAVARRRLAEQGVRPPCPRHRR